MSSIPAPLAQTIEDLLLSHCPPDPASASGDLPDRILVLDDEASMLDLYHDTLGRDPRRFEVVAVSTQEEAVEAVRRALEQDRPFAMALLDVRLGDGGDGISAGEAIRQMDPEVEVVLVTGGNALDLEAVNKRIPPADKLLYLEKPVLPRELAQLACSLSAKWRARAELNRLSGRLARSVEERADKQQALEAQLRQIQKMEALGALAGGIAHDFNNILGVIMGYAEIIQDEGQDSPETRRRTGEILAAGRRARDLIDQILNFSRQAPRDRRSRHLSELVDEAVRFLRSSIPASVEIGVDVSCSDDLAAVDPTEFHQVVMNLCSNAAQALPEGGTISLELADAQSDDPHAEGLDDPGWFLRLTVADNGPGMSQEVRERVFEPFFTTKPVGQGTGIGLSVVHGIVRNHDGMVAVDSIPGQGSAFHVYLPRSRRTGAATPEPEARLVPAHGRVLFVDDEKPLVDIGMEMLTDFGFEVVGRTSSVEALEAFRYRPQSFDLVVADYAMPNMTGLEMAREMLKLRPGMPIILCTGFSEALSEERARSLGISDVIMKPILKSKLIKSVSRLLAEPEHQT